MAKLTAELPARHRAAASVADQSVTVDHAIDDFMTSLWQSVAIILVVSFISLGVRAGLVVALSIPLTLAIVFAADEHRRHRHAARVAGRADHRPGAARRRRHDHDRRDDDAARRRREEGEGGHLRLHALRHGDAGGHARHHRRLRADRLRGQFRRGVHLLAVRCRQHRARGVLARRRDLLAGARRGDPRSRRRRSERPSRAPSPNGSAAC